MSSWWESAKNWWNTTKSQELIRSHLDSLGLETGDVLLFHGEGFWFSWVVEWATWSELSHTAIVLKDPTYLAPHLKGYYMLESGTERFPDAIEHKIHFGVQVVNLEKVLQYYTGKAWVRKLNVPDEMRQSKFPIEIEKIWGDIKDLPYDADIWDLFRIEFGLNWGDMNRMNKFFCSALVTFVYERFKLLIQDVPWDLITPEDYNEGGKIDRLLKPGISLDKKIRLK